MKDMSVRYGDTSTLYTMRMNRPEMYKNHMEKEFKQLAHDLSHLTIAGQKLFTRLCHAANKSEGEPVNRQQIALLMQRPRGQLYPHDRALLAELVDLDLVQCERRRFVQRGRTYASGSQYVYSITAKTCHVFDALQEVARRKDKPLRSVILAYAMQR